MRLGNAKSDSSSILFKEDNEKNPANPDLKNTNAIMTNKKRNEKKESKIEESINK